MLLTILYTNLYNIHQDIFLSWTSQYLRKHKEFLFVYRSNTTDDQNKKSIFIFYDFQRFVIHNKLINYLCFLRYWPPDDKIIARCLIPNGEIRRSQFESVLHTASNKKTWQMKWLLQFLSTFLLAPLPYNLYYLNFQNIQFENRLFRKLLFAKTFIKVKWFSSNDFFKCQFFWTHSLILKVIIL